MWLLDLFRNIGGIGTELGIVNLALIVSVGYLLRREAKRIKAKVDPVYERDVSEILKEHDAMWDEHEYQKRKSASGKLSFSDKEMVAGMVGEILRAKEKSDAE